MSYESFAQQADSNEKSVSSFEDNLLKNEQDSSVESDFSISSQSAQPQESPIILENLDDQSPQEGIKDAFSQDQGDRFQSKTEGRPPNEKNNNVQPNKETSDAQNINSQ